MNKFIKRAKRQRHQAKIDVDGSVLSLSGDWTWQYFDEKAVLTQLPELTPGEVTLDCKEISEFDLSGAYFLDKLQTMLASKHEIVALQSVSAGLQVLLDKVVSQTRGHYLEIKKTRVGFLETIGRSTAQLCRETLGFFEFNGRVLLSFFGVVKYWRHIHWHLILDVIDRSGLGALWIVGLLVFLVGIVLSYQIGLQLSVYGASIYVVNLLGISVLREFGPLITAIIIAGRSGSAFAAQIGSMRIQEEVDALQTIGISPIRRLVLPRVIGLIIVLPLLVVWADLFGLLGGMIMAKVSFGIDPKIFFDRLVSPQYMTNYMIGLIKAPIFALLIAVVGCYRGFCVSGSTLSVGNETTKSVVQAIFLIIVADAGFSIIFSTVGI